MNFDEIRIKWRAVAPELQSFVVGAAMGFVLGFVFGVAVRAWLS